jgi:predicted metal-dependent peptidase
MKQLIPTEEKLEIAASLEDYHKMFFVFFELADVFFTDIPTAAICFPRQGKPEMQLGKKFWEGLTPREKLFVVCHECMHVMLDHGVRNGLNVKGATPELVNIAQDITINEMIVDLFGFDRNDLRDWKKYCWIDTCFKAPQLIARNETFLYYLEKLIKDPPPSTGDGGPSTLDEHSDHREETETEKKNRQQVAETLAEELDVGDLEKIIKALPEQIGNEGAAGQLAGSAAGALEKVIKKKVKKLKIRFAHLIRKLKKTSMKMVEKDVETFTHRDRRFNNIMKNSEVALPGKNAVERPVADRLLTAVFMDVSGSCMSYFDTFQNVFLAFDEERMIFDTLLYFFDQRVQPVKVGDAIMIGGGTSFKIIERECLELERTRGRYPDCVVVITDGYGDTVEPKAASKWVWLLTPGSTREYVPSKSRVFLISQVTFEK